MGKFRIDIFLRIWLSQPVMSKLKMSRYGGIGWPNFLMP